MTNTEQYTCIGCPIGCPLSLTHKRKTIIEVSGNECNRGAKYAHQEFTDPRRNLSTTVAISNARWLRLPVRTTAPVQKDRVMAAVKKIHQLKVEAPVKLGQILIENFLGEEGLHVVACRSMETIDHGSDPAIY